MKKILTATSLLMIFSTSVFAQIPQELQNLIPAGRSDVRVDGRTSDNAKCTIDISSVSFGYAANIAVLDEQGNLDSRRFAKFQIGLGHELQRFINENNTLVAISVHKKGSQYSNDTRSTFKVNSVGNAIKSVQVIDESKGLFGYKTEANETCFLN
jgi:type 1 fimbria pilin